MTKWRAVSIPTQKTSGDLPRASGLTASPGRTGGEAAMHGPLPSAGPAHRRANTALLVTGLFEGASTSGLPVLGDIDLAVIWEPPRGVGFPAAADALVGKWDTAFGGTRSYLLQINASRQIQIRWSNDGTAELTMASDTAIPETDAARGYRATLDVDNGAAGRTATFYTSDDFGRTWNQLGGTVTTAGTTSINAGTAATTVGLASGGFTVAQGFYYEAWVRDGIDGTLLTNPKFYNNAAKSVQMRDDQGRVWNTTSTMVVA